MTAVAIQGDMFLIDGQLANAGKHFRGIPLDGLLLNSRMINGAFDDSNSETVAQWAYPDTGVWDPNRNTAEFIAAMSQWKTDGLNAFTIGIQGGSPQGYSTSQPWNNAGFTSDGRMLESYQHRLAMIIEEADRLGLVVILCIFYHGQDHRLAGEDAIRAAVVDACNWVLQMGWRNLMIEIANEVNLEVHYTHQLLKHPRIHELIELAQSVELDGRRLLVSTSFAALEPFATAEVIDRADYLLVHGNGTPYPDRLREMVDWIRSKPNYRGQPIAFNEDDHFDFDKPENNMSAALAAGASWGFFDPGSVTLFPPKPTRGDYNVGYQAVPINWTPSTPTKKAFFDALKEIY